MCDHRGGGGNNTKPIINTIHRQLFCKIENKKKITIQNDTIILNINGSPFRRVTTSRRRNATIINCHALVQILIVIFR